MPVILILSRPDRKLGLLCPSGNGLGLTFTLLLRYNRSHF